MNVEEKYQDVLQNLEGAIVVYYRANPDLIDAEVETAMDWLIKIYSAEAQGKTSSPRSPRGTSGQVAEAVKMMCELRLGRREVEAEDEEGNPVELDIKPLAPSEIVECLKRIKSSLKMWTKQGGRQGYLKFVNRFFP